MFGIPENSFWLIKAEIENIGAIEKAAIYGSRAIGIYKRSSDIDLVLFGSKIAN